LILEDGFGCDRLDDCLGNDLKLTRPDTANKRVLAGKPDQTALQSGTDDPDSGF